MLNYMKTSESTPQLYTPANCKILRMEKCMFIIAIFKSPETFSRLLSHLKICLGIYLETSEIQLPYFLS